MRRQDSIWAVFSTGVRVRVPPPLRGKEPEMGTGRRTYEMGFKRHVVEEVESGLLRPAEAARKYDLSPSLIERWREKYRDGTLVERPTTEELALRAENERLKIKVAEQALENDLLKKRMDYERRQKKERSSIVTGRNLAVYAGGAK